MKILHITPHLGGGVGKVLLNWLTSSQSNGILTHEIAALESVNDSARLKTEKAHITLSDNLFGKENSLYQSIYDADIVLIHWWNHPKLYDFIINASLPPCRLIFWSHVSGYSATQKFSHQLLSFPDKFVMSTPYSTEMDLVEEYVKENQNNDIRVICSCAGIDHVIDIKPKPHENFVVGYIGTVDYCKLHSEFLSMSAHVAVPDIKFVVCGGDKHHTIKQEARELGIADSFVFNGPVESITDHLSSFDVFGYPLSKDHYGTGEQAIIEAMAAGVPVVVFNNGSERNLVNNGVTGIIVNTPDEYTTAIEQLAHDSNLRKTISENCKTYAKIHFSLDAMIHKWNDLFKESMFQQKKRHLWLKPYPLKGADLFLESLGDCENPFFKSKYSTTKLDKNEAEKTFLGLPSVFNSSTRGSPFHYRTLFPHDSYLNLWCGLLELQLGKFEKALSSLMLAQKIGESRISPIISTLLKDIKHKPQNTLFISEIGDFRFEQAKLLNSFICESEESCVYS